MKLPLPEALRKARSWLQNAGADYVFVKRVTQKTPDTIFVANSEEPFAYVPEKMAPTKSQGDGK